MKIFSRLARQLASQGVKNPYRMARGLLIKRGHMTRSGKLTAAGRKRNRMTPSQRAKDRAARATGHKKSDYTYNPKTNRVKLKK